MEKGLMHVMWSWLHHISKGPLSFIAFLSCSVLLFLIYVFPIRIFHYLNISVIIFQFFQTRLDFWESEDYLMVWFSPWKGAKKKCLNSLLVILSNVSLCLKIEEEGLEVYKQQYYLLMQLRHIFFLSFFNVFGC